jgi:23S rRNA pseudouridine955/2504/2580 synthase
MAEFKTIDESALNQRLDNYLIKKLKGVPKSRIYRIIRKGEVRVNKGRKKVDYKLQMDDIVRIPPIRMTEPADISVSNKTIIQLKKALLYEDNGLLIFNKESGLAVHGGSGIKLGLIELCRQVFGAHLELIHRIDRDTSGCILVAKKRSVLKNLQQQFQDKTIKKTYVALVKKSWAKKTHTINLPLLKNIQKSGERMVVINSQGKEAISHFRPIKNFEFEGEDLSFVEVNIETGRTHQIRVHAQSAGHQIIGDTKYGDDMTNRKFKKLGLGRLFLHAKELRFYNPSLEKMQTIQAPVTEDFIKISGQEFEDESRK